MEKAVYPLPVKPGENKLIFQVICQKPCDNHGGNRGQNTQYKNFEKGAVEDLGQSPRYGAHDIFHVFILTGIAPKPPLQENMGLLYQKARKILLNLIFYACMPHGSSYTPSII